MQNDPAPDPAVHATDAPTAAELSEIMALYATATEELRANQENLRARVRELSGELAARNRELSSRVEELSSLKNYLANILESITDGVLTIDPNRRLVAVNKAAADILSVAGGPAVREREAGDAGAAPVEQVLRGSLRGIARLLCAALDSEEAVTNREVLIDTDTEPRLLTVSANPIRNSANALLGAVATFRDDTEIRRLELVVRRKDRLAALGEMAAGVAHEIRNPLGGIELYASGMRRTLAPESREARTCDKIIRAVASLNRIVTDMLVFTRGRAPVTRAVSLDRIAAGAAELAEHEASTRGVIIHRAFREHATEMSLDPDQMTQAVLNILLNAVQMTPEGGTVEVRTRRDASAARIEVADGGPGVPPELADRIFDPFFTTRDKGTGLGLAIVHKIVQDHGGSVTVEANVPSGAVFSIILPLPGDSAP